MSTIVTRAGKGSPLTNTELDSNFTNLNTDKLELSGGTLTGNLSLGDGVSANFGASNDLTITHTGSSSILKENGTGTFYIQGTDIVFTNSAGSERYADFTDNGAVRLYHDNSIKLSTTSTGIDVTGSVVADGLTVDGGTASPIINLSRSGTYSGITFSQTVTNVTGAGADLSTYSLNANTGYVWQTCDSGGTTAKALYIAPNKDISFYNDSANQGLFWDSSTSQLFLGATSASALNSFGDDLVISNTASGTGAGISIIANATNGYSNLYFGDTADGDVGRVQYNHADNSLTFRTNTQNALVIDSSQNATFSGSVTSTGLTVEGNSVFTTADNSAQVTLISTDTDALVGPKLNLWRNSGTGTNGDLIGEITFTGEDTVGSTNVFASISSIAEQTNNGAEDGSLHFNTLLNGTLAKRLSIGSASTGGDISFYDSSGSSQNLFWDSSTSRLGLGVTNPVSALAMHGNAGTTYITQTNTANNQTLEMGNAYSLITGANGSHSAIVSDHTLLFGTSNTERLRINADGSSVFSGAVTSTGLPLNVNTSMYATDHSLSYYGSTNAVYLNGAGNSGWLRLNASGVTNDSVSHNLFGINAGNLQTFKTNSTLAMQIDASQNVNIPNGSLMVGSTTAPSYPLEVQSGGVGTVLRAGTSFVSIDSVGSASSPSLILNGDDNTGIWHPASDTLAVSTGGSERLRIDNQGRVGIGTSSPDSKMHLYDGALHVQQTDGSDTWFGYGSSNDNYITTGTGGITVFREVGSEKMRLSGGNLLVGTTGANTYSSTVNTGVQIAPDFIGVARNQNTVMHLNRQGNDGTIVDFRTFGFVRGSVSISGSTTSYNTSSDERLKDNIIDAPIASEDIDAIQVRSFDWKADGEHQKYGMVAQELLEVAPDAVTQGDTPDDMMGVDYSKLVPMLIKEIQSLRNRVAQLEE